MQSRLSLGTRLRLVRLGLDGHLGLVPNRRLVALAVGRIVRHSLQLRALALVSVPLCARVRGGLALAVRLGTVYQVILRLLENFMLVLLVQLGASVSLVEGKGIAAVWELRVTGYRPGRIAFGPELCL